MKACATNRGIGGLLFVLLLAVLPAAEGQEPGSITSVRSTRMTCSSCHTLHGGTSTLLKQVGNQLCMDCHDPVTGTDPLAPKRVTHRNGSTNSLIPFQIPCLGCHNPHYYLKNKRGALGRLAQDPATSVEQPCQDSDPNNNIPYSGTGSTPPSSTNGYCANFSLLSNIRDDINGAKLRFKIKAVLQSTVSQSGLGAYNQARTVDGYTVDVAWTTDSSTAGAWLRSDLGVNDPTKTREFLETRLFVLAPDYAGIYNVQYSDDATNWSNAVTGFVPNLQGWNTIRWSGNGTGPGAHRYWRLLLTNTPGAGPDLTEWELYGPTDCTVTGGTPAFDASNFYLGCDRTHVVGRVEPLTVGKGQTAVTYNDWASPTAPYQGVCNVCHTRTQHHRNNDILDPNDPFYTSPDHDHNVTRRCTDCHDHNNAGFSKNQ